MNKEFLKTSAGLAVKFLFEPLADRKYPGGWNGLVFDAVAENMATRYAKGRVTMEEVKARASVLREDERFVGRDFMERFQNFRMEHAMRIAPPEPEAKG